jgi:hypothetical protein
MLNRKPRTDAQREASRVNGAKSKGPVTPEGKARSARNALKTGITAETLLIEGESQASFEAFFVGIWVSLDPQSPAEQSLVEEYIFHHWRLRRLVAIERAMLNHQKSLLEEPTRPLILCRREQTRLQRAAALVLREYETLIALRPTLPTPDPTGPTIFETAHRAHLDAQAKSPQPLTQAAAAAPQIQNEPSDAPEFHSPGTQPIPIQAVFSWLGLRITS